MFSETCFENPRRKKMKFNLLFVDDIQDDIDDFEKIHKEHFSNLFNIETLCCPKDCPDPVTKKIQDKLDERLNNENPVDLLLLDNYFDRRYGKTIVANDILNFLRRQTIYYKRLPVIVLTKEDSWDLSDDLIKLWQPLDFITKNKFKDHPDRLREKIFNLLQTVARYFVECLQKQGVQRVYGIPGTEVLEIIHAIRETQEAGEEKIEYILTGHEQGAAFMANGAGRVNENRVPGVCLATLGPGATNLMTGIADAYEDKSSVVVITGQAPSRRVGKESHQAENTLDMFTSFTKYQKKIESSDATEISSAVAKAFDIARGENPGPVLLEVPNDVAESIVTNYVDPVDPFGNQNKVTHQDIVSLPTATCTMIKEAVKRIKKAKRPIIIAGSGANRAAQNAMCSDYTIHNMLTKLVDDFHIPITTTFMGKGSISSDNKLCLPVVGCRQAKNDYDLANVALDAADLIITVGYDFFEFESDIWNFYRREEDKTNIINISFAPPQIDYCYNPDLILLGSITTNLEKIYSGLACCKDYQPPDCRWLKLVEHLKKRHAKEFETYLSDKSKLTPHQVIKTVRECFDECPDRKTSDILVSDGGFHKMVTARFYKTYHPNTCLIPNGFSTVGYALPVAIGVKMEHPERRVVATIGDGGFMMNNQELATAVHYKKNIVVILLRDGYHGLIKIKNANKYPVEIEDAVKLPDVINFAKLAKSMDAQGIKVRNVDELRDALGKALEDASKQGLEDANAGVNKQAQENAKGQSTLIEAVVDYDVVKFDNIKSNCPPDKRLKIRDKIINGDEDWEEPLRKLLEE